jgi:hypothetical protein
MSKLVAYSMFDPSDDSDKEGEGTSQAADDNPTIGQLIDNGEKYAT